MILASGSPRRKELLSLITGDFRVIPALGEESIPLGTPPREAVMLLAARKAEEVFGTHHGEIIIAADTVVAIGNKIFGKPSDEKDAARMLTELSGQVHSVFTGVCILNAAGKQKLFAQETRVELWPLTENEIAEYIATKEPMDKAGAYGIQGLGSLLVKQIDGDFYNVMGLPVSRLYRELRTV